MDIKDASTEELMTELLDRCSPAIFIGSRNEGMDDGGRMTFFHYRGNPAVCYGMCHELAMGHFSDDFPTRNEEKRFVCIFRPKYII